MARVSLSALMLTTVVLAGALVFALPSGDKEQLHSADKKEVRVANRPKVPGKLRPPLRERREEPAGSGKIKVVERTVDWEVSETAIIVCDMWDDHHCKIAAQRVGVHGAADEPGAHGRPRPRRHDHPRPQRNHEHVRRNALPQADGAGQARQAAGADRQAVRPGRRRREPPTLPVDIDLRLRRRRARSGGSAAHAASIAGSTSSASTASATAARRSTTSASRKGSRTSS